VTSTVRAAARRRLRRDAGAGTLEYVGVTALAGVLILVLIMQNWGGLIGATAHAMCTIEEALGVAPGGSLGCGSPATRTPYEQAVSGRYVAMGDSYSSGEGGSDYEPGTDFDDRDDLWPFNNDEEAHNRCHRSADAYSRQIVSGNSFAKGSTFVACSGSVTSDLNNPNHKDTGEKPQTDALSDDVSLVTLTMGGNDLKFAQVVQDCIVSGAKHMDDVPHLQSCQDKHDQRIAQQLPELRRQLVEYYKEIHQKSPNARVVVVGYPQLFMDNPRDNYNDLLFAEDQRWMNQKAADLNANLAQAAKEAGAEYVDPTDAFRGHGIGSSDPWMSDLAFGGPGWTVADPGSFHPNAAGQAALARLVQQQLENPRR
jgi:lysophospholipase L1-like esterase